MRARAVELKVIQSLYTVEKMSLLKSSSLSDKDIRANLQGFCTQQEKATDCRDRYLRMGELELRKLRTAIVKDENNQGHLMSDAPFFAREVGEIAPGKPRETQVTYAPKFSELDALYKASAQPAATGGPSRNLSAAGRPTSLTAAERLQSLEPSLEDYIRTKQIPRDPGNLANGTLTVYETTPEGTLLYDTAKYQTALQKWHLDKQRKADFSVMKAIASAPQPPLNPNRSLSADVGSVSVRAFGKARGKVVDAANVLVAGLKGTPAPAPAAGASQDAAATAGPQSGSVAIKPGAQAVASLETPVDQLPASGKYLDSAATVGIDLKYFDPYF